MMAAHGRGAQAGRCQRLAAESCVVFDPEPPRKPAAKLFPGPKTGCESHNVAAAKTQTPLGFWRNHPQQCTVPSAFLKSESLQLPWFRQTLRNRNGTCAVDS